MAKMLPIKHQLVNELSVWADQTTWPREPHPLHAPPWRHVRPKSSVTSISRSIMAASNVFTQSTWPFRAAMCTGNMPLVPRLVGGKKREGESKDTDSCEKKHQRIKMKVAVARHRNLFRGMYQARISTNGCMFWCANVYFQY